MLTNDLVRKIAPSLIFPILFWNKPLIVDKIIISIRRRDNLPKEKESLPKNISRCSITLFLESITDILLVTLHPID